MTDEKSFLSRWSQRKTTETRRPPEAAPAEADVTVEMEPGESAGQDVAPAGPAERGGEAEAATDPLPDIDSLGKDSDYTGFMKEGVPEHLQKLALRKLWQSDPVFGFRDGLDDYDEDFSFAEGIVEQVKTAYRAGSGYEAEEPESEAEGEADGGDSLAVGDDLPESGDDDAEQSGTSGNKKSPVTGDEVVPDGGKV